MFIECHTNVEKDKFFVLHILYDHVILGSYLLKIYFNTQIAEEDCSILFISTHGQGEVIIEVITKLAGLHSYR
mgnify:CR=1 FL=1